jgi:hypothetical protein
VDPVALRADVEAIATAVCTALVKSLPRDAVRAIWLTGSAAKDWTSPLDYVPELSDVDLHLWLQEDRRDAQRVLEDLDAGLQRHAMVEQAFSELRPEPVHTPRVQFVLHNDLLRLDGYIPAPRDVVRTLYGAEYRFARAEEVGGARRVDARALMSAGDESVLQHAIIDLVERPGHHFYHLLRTVSWRVSPITARVLSARGVAYEQAWSANRTAGCQLLGEVGETQLASDLVGYYGGAWRSQASAWGNSAANREIFAAAIRALRRGREVGEEVSRALS